MNRRTRETGFTLIEILVVLVILGLLAGLVGPRLFGKVDSSKVRTAETQVRMPVSYTHLRAHETVLDLVCRLLLEKKKTL